MTLDFDVASNGSSQKDCGSRYQLVQIQRLRLQYLPFGEGQQLCGQSRGTLGLFADLVEGFPGLSICRCAG